MSTVLDKALKRAITVDDADYVVTVDPDGLRVTGKGKRKPQVQLTWRDLLSGEAALAVALNASLADASASGARTAGGAQTGKRAAKKAAKPRP